MGAPVSISPLERAARDAELAAQYAETMLDPEVAARSGHLDELIAPRDTRARIAWALRSPGGDRR
jgi:propionyl-CoA carboxylase beta chain